MIFFNISFNFILWKTNMSNLDLSLDFLCGLPEVKTYVDGKSHPFHLFLRVGHHKYN